MWGVGMYTGDLHIGQVLKLAKILAIYQVTRGSFSKYKFWGRTAWKFIELISFKDLHI